MPEQNAHDARVHRQPPRSLSAPAGRSGRWQAIVSNACSSGNGVIHKMDADTKRAPAEAGAREMMMRVLLLIALLVAACGGGGKTITGTFVLTSNDVSWSASDCHGTNGYDDIRVGSGVTVRDGKNTVVGTGALALNADGSSGGRCAYTFSVPISAADFYVIEVGHRGGLTYSAADLEANGWKVDVTLG